MRKNENWKTTEWAENAAEEIMEKLARCYRDDRPLPESSDELITEWQLADIITVNAAVEIAQLRKHLDRLLIAGNHLGNYLGIIPHPPHTATIEDGMKFFNERRHQNDYDVWMCWREIMQVAEEMEKDKA